MRILILGDCNLGKALKTTLKKEHDVFQYTSVNKIKEINPDIIICSNKAKQIIKNCSSETYIIYLSTDKVFNSGTYNFDAIPNPINKYKEKYEEEKIIQTHEKHLIIRLPFILEKDLVLEMAKKIKAKKEVTYDNKVLLYPVCVEDVSDLINTLISMYVIEKNFYKVIHVRGTDKTTLYQIALQIASIYKIIINHINSSLNETKEPTHIKLSGIVLPTRTRQMLLDFLGVKK